MELSQEKWPVAEELFEAALALPPEQRRSFLAKTASEEKLRQFVERLLDAHEQSGTLAPETPEAALSRIFEFEDTSKWEGRILGNYRLDKKVGEGGMGVVFLASRHDGAYEKNVAVKVIRIDIRNHVNRSRFQTERQLMARLEHPNIARLIDGGTADDVPYLVMEYVDGTPMTTYCNQKRLSVRQRLSMFTKVCDAVQVAHQNLIVHRDIKPGNILVTDEGVPKLLDFGIAKLLDPTGASQTQTQHRLLTPSYASPEQLLGKSVTTGSDVYSLGVLLFELLTGYRPHSLEKQRTPVEVAASGHDPSAPSTILAKHEATEGHHIVGSIATDRRTTPSHLKKMLRGDLDAILLKALRPDPGHRYATASQLAEDLNRHLKNQPVLARKNTLAYQSVKFFKRHTTAVSAAAILLLAGLAFLVSNHFQALRLAKERDLANASTQLFMDSFQMADPSKARGETITALEILKNAEEKVLREHRGHPELQARLHAAMGQVYLNLKMNDRAEPLLNQALEAQTELFGQDDLRTAGTKASLARLAFNKADYKKAERLALESLKLRRKNKDDPQRIADSLTIAANARRAGGERRGALPLFEEALGILRREGEGASLELAKTLNAFGYTLTLVSEYEKAEPLYLECADILERTIQEPYPLKARVLRRLCDLYVRWGKLDKAEPYLEAALQMNRKLYGEEHVRIAVNLHDWARLKKNRGDLFGAETLYRESLAMKSKLLGDTHPGLNGTLINLASLLHEDGTWGEGEVLFRRALDIHHARFKQANFNLAFLEQKLGMLLKDVGKWQEAEQLLCNSMDGYLYFSSQPLRRHAEAQLEWVSTLLLQGEQAGAEEALQQCLPVFKARKDSTRIGRVETMLAELTSGK